MKPQPNALYYGDCLDVLREWPAGVFDLVYLDPPFNSKTNYNVLFGDRADRAQAQVMAFEDTWHWDDRAMARVDSLKRAVKHPAHEAISGLHVALGDCGMMAYLSYMAERLTEIRRVLKNSGSVYLHCDPTASHYLKVVMDAVFGHGNFRNEIVWRIGWISGFKSQKRGWIRNHDTLLYYVRGQAAIKQFNKEYIPYPEGYVRRDGKRPTGKGVPVEDTWNCSRADVLDSIMIKSFSTEKLGYPTQKPVALLERIIRASSNPGDFVLDPFCGCGTTIDAARRLKRRWVGIDVSPLAIDLVKKRRLADRDIPVHGVPVNVEMAGTMARSAPFEFEKWAVSRIPGIAPNSKQVGDGGIDGRGHLLDAPAKDGLVLAQVKGGRFDIGQLRAFAGVVNDARARLGIYITLDKVTSRAGRALAQRQGTVKMGASRYPKMQLWSIADHFEDREPKLPPLADPYTGKSMNLDMYAD